GGATQLGTTSDNYAPCTDDGQNCANDIYAVSLPSEIPSGNITWFQAQEACANAGKRLPTSAEWEEGGEGAVVHGGDSAPPSVRVAPRRRRHGRQPLRVGGGLGAALDRVSGMGRLQR